MIKKLTSILLAALLVVTMLSACGETEAPLTLPAETEPSTPLPVTPPAPPPPAPPPALPPDELYKLWQRTDGSTATIPLTEAMHKYFGVEGLPPEHRMTSYAYGGLISRLSDIIFVTRPSENELAMAEEAGVELEVIPVTKDALVFLVNVENPVKNVTLSQLRDIYTGKITSWNALGGGDTDIIPYQRPVDSGSQTLFLQLLMGDEEPMEPPSEWRPESMGALVERVSNYDNSRDSIGFSVFYYVNSMYGNSRFRLLGIDGVVPTHETIARGEYALEDYYYAVIRSDTPEDSIARRLIKWLLTDEGQTVAAAAGYVPLRPIGDIGQDGELDPVYLGDTENSSGTGGTERVSSEERTAMRSENIRKPLSDMFYNGFNYIRYINDEIADQLQFYVGDFWPDIPLEEREGMRPFTGIPNDYTNYTLAAYDEYSFIQIEFPEGNPFFKSAWSFSIPLTSDISPYGIEPEGYSITYAYERLMLPHVDLYSVSIDIPDVPDASERINMQLKSWTAGFENDRDAVKLIEGFLVWYSDINMIENPDFVYKLQPTVERWGDYLSVHYILQTYDGPAMDMPMVFTSCFDMKTGEAVKLADTLPPLSELDYSSAYAFAPRWFKADGSLEPPSSQEGYVPAAGSVVTDAWVQYGRINMLVREPDGRVLQILFWQ